MSTIRLVGRYGAAYDPPETRRAYTYVEQPDNLGAYRLGSACVAAAQEPGGDFIDQGLSLLKALSNRGFGVFELENNHDQDT